MKKTVEEPVSVKSNIDKETVGVIAALILLASTMLIHFTIRTWIGVFAVAFVILAWYYRYT